MLLCAGGLCWKKAQRRAGRIAEAVGFGGVDRGHRKRFPVAAQHSFVDGVAPQVQAQESGDVGLGDAQGVGRRQVVEVLRLDGQAVADPHQAGMVGAVSENHGLLEGRRNADAGRQIAGGAAFGAGAVVAEESFVDGGVVGVGIFVLRAVEGEVGADVPAVEHGGGRGDRRQGGHHPQRIAEIVLVVGPGRFDRHPAAHAVADQGDVESGIVRRPAEVGQNVVEGVEEICHVGRAAGPHEDGGDHPVAGQVAGQLAVADFAEAVAVDQQGELLAGQRARRRANGKLEGQIGGRHQARGEGRGAGIGKELGLRRGRRGRAQRERRGQGRGEQGAEEKAGFFGRNHDGGLRLRRPPWPPRSGTPRRQILLTRLRIFLLGGPTRARRAKAIWKTSIGRISRRWSCGSVR